ncbi:unnamed protein product [Linum tenue]|uniref:Uncharacterized protein n=1 Tax=Linum tenue TaxID=586396 RepID=A0AAV0IQF9_9ROSI|nr:unnamed protein product [Linum tenue]
MRVKFYNAHLASVRQAISEKEVKVKGFFAWSYADNYEWSDGYSGPVRALLHQIHGRKALRLPAANV